jgi:transcriptional regulator with XRE-family HTH domain
MTTLIVIDGHKPGGRRSSEVAARFRSELGRLDISASAAARRCHQSQAWMARRTSGKTPFDVDDLDMVCGILGMSYDYIATGIKELPAPGGDQVSERSPVQTREGAPRPALRIVR